MKFTLFNMLFGIFLIGVIMCYLLPPIGNINQDQDLQEAKHQGQVLTIQLSELNLKRRIQMSDGPKNWAAALGRHAKKSCPKCPKCSLTMVSTEVCSQCHSPDIETVSIGDEGWLVCESCRSTEQGTVEVLLCGNGHIQAIGNPQ